MMHFALFIFLFFPQICGLTFLVQWRGEKDFAYSPRELREAEFRNALSATLTSPLQLSPQLAFETVMEGSEQPNQTNQNDIIQLVHTDVDPATIVAGASRCATGEGERGAKRRASNVRVGNEIRADSYLCTRRATSVITVIIRVPNPNPFRDFLRSLQCATSIRLSATGLHIARARPPLPWNLVVSPRRRRLREVGP